jgi:hypothetical protein
MAWRVWSKTVGQSAGSSAREPPAQRRRKSGQHQQPRRTTHGDDPARHGEQGDLRDHADGPQHADGAVGDALPLPVERAEAVIERVARLDQTGRQQEPEKEGRANEVDGVGEFESPQQPRSARSLPAKLTRQQVGA